MSNPANARAFLVDDDALSPLPPSHVVNEGPPSPPPYEGFPSDIRAAVQPSPESQGDTLSDTLPGAISGPGAPDEHAHRLDRGGREAATGDVVVDSYDEVPYHDLRAEASRRGLDVGAHPKKDELVAALEAHDTDAEAAETTTE